MRIFGHFYSKSNELFSFVVDDKDLIDSVFVKITNEGNGAETRRNITRGDLWQYLKDFAEEN